MDPQVQFFWGASPASTGTRRGRYERPRHGPYEPQRPNAAEDPTVVLPWRTNVISDRGDAAVVGDDDISG